MDARLHGRQRNLKLESRLPGRHVRGGVAGCANRAAQCTIAPMHRPRVAAAVVPASGPATNAALHPPAIAHKCGIAFDLFGGADVFKRTPYIADLKPAGRFVAKYLFDANSVSLLMKTLLDSGVMHGDCMTVTGCAMAANVNCVAWNADQKVVRPANQEAEFEKRRAAWQPQAMAFGSGYVCKYAQQVGPARHGAVADPVGVAEKACYADI